MNVVVAIPLFRTEPTAQGQRWIVLEREGGGYNIMREDSDGTRTRLETCASTVSAVRKAKVLRSEPSPARTRKALKRG